MSCDREVRSWVDLYRGSASRQVVALGCRNQAMCRRDVARDGCVGSAPGLVYHTLLHPGCRPSLSTGTIDVRASCIGQGASVCYAVRYTSRPREAGALRWWWNPFRVPDGKPQLKQASTASARAEPKLHASIIIDINIASIIIFQPIWIIIIKHHHAENYESHSFSTVFASELD